MERDSRWDRMNEFWVEYIKKLLMKKGVPIKKNEHIMYEVFLHVFQNFMNAKTAMINNS